MFDPGEIENHPHSCGELRYSKAENLGTGKTEGTIVLPVSPALTCVRKKPGQTF